VMTERQHMHAVLQSQLPGGMHEDIVTEGMERLAEAGGRHDAAAAGQPAALRVFEHEEVTLFAGEGDRLIRCRLTAFDDRRQLLTVRRQGGDAYRAVDGQPLDFRQVREGAQALDEHGRSPPYPTSRSSAERSRARPSRISASGMIRLGARRITSGPAWRPSNPPSSARRMSCPAWPRQRSANTAPINRPWPRTSENTPSSSASCRSPAVSRSRRSPTPPSTWEESASG